MSNKIKLRIIKDADGSITTTVMREGSILRVEFNLDSDGHGTHPDQIKELLDFVDVRCDTHETRFVGNPK